MKMTKQERMLELLKLAGKMSDAAINLTGGCSPLKVYNIPPASVKDLSSLTEVLKETVLAYDKAVYEEMLERAEPTSGADEK